MMSFCSSFNQKYPIKVLIIMLKVLIFNLGYDTQVETNPCDSDRVSKLILCFIRVSKLILFLRGKKRCNCILLRWCPDDN